MINSSFSKYVNWDTLNPDGLSDVIGLEINPF